MTSVSCWTWRAAVVASGLVGALLLGCGDDDASAPGPRPDNLEPVAVLTVPATARVGVPILLDGSLSSDSDGTLDAFLFEISAYTQPAEVVLEAVSPQLFHTFAANGRYEVILTVVDNDGTKASDNATIDVFD